MSWILPTLILAPLVGAVVGAFLPEGKLPRLWAMGVSLFVAVVAAVLLFGYDFKAAAEGATNVAKLRSTVQVQWPEYNPQAPDDLGPLGVQDIGFGVRLGVDSVALWLTVLTAWLTPLAVLASFASIKDRQKQYYAWMLALLSFMVGVFLARDALLFYVFFELTLIPMFFIIGIWGGPDRRYAAGKFFLFTFAGSVLTLAGVIYLGAKSGTFDLISLAQYAQTLDPTVRFWLLLAMLAGFAVKVPLFPVHTWLPLAHTEAPTAGSVILAGVLLKLGTYGILKLALPIGLIGADLNAIVGSFHLIPFWKAFPVDVTIGGVVHLLGVLCVIGIIYGALVAWVQQDIKKLVAYSSVSHLGFCVLGLLALNTIGMQASVLYMINHGISTGAMFLVIGMLYDRYHNRDIRKFSGLGRKMPILAFFWILFTMSSIGLPGTNGFVSEFLSILGAFSSSTLGITFAAVASLGVILGAIYMLHLSQSVIFGPLKTPEHDHSHDAGGHAHEEHLPRDLSAREIGILVPLAIAVIVLGVAPTPVLKSIEHPLTLSQQNLTQPASRAEVPVPAATALAPSAAPNVAAD
jgi:NADH-quinone oxidoreductase subunit M